MVTKTFDLVDEVHHRHDHRRHNKCNKCHEALGTTFHTADRAGTSLPAATALSAALTSDAVGSIDSYVHAIRDAPFDIGDIDFTDPCRRWGTSITSLQPQLRLMNCGSCHNEGTYEVLKRSVRSGSTRRRTSFDLGQGRRRRAERDRPVSERVARATERMINHDNAGD
jgi:hypothetical protein